MSWSEEDPQTEQLTMKLRVNNGVIEQAVKVTNHRLIETVTVWKPIPIINNKINEN